MKLKDLINELLKIYNKHGDIPIKHYSGNVCSYNDIESNDVKCVVHNSDLAKSWNFVSGEKFVCIGEEVSENLYEDYLVTEFSEECEKELVELLRFEIDNLSKNIQDENERYQEECRQLKIDPISGKSTMSCVERNMEFNL